MQEAEKAVTGLLAELGIAASDLWNIILLSPGADHNSSQVHNTTQGDQSLHLQAEAHPEGDGVRPDRRPHPRDAG